MPFPNSVMEDALVRSRRCCCVCHEFAGLYVNVHHIIPEGDEGSDELENAIVLCLRCHGEAGHYNVRHPIGKKYSPQELRRHRDEWWEWCEKNPDAPLPKTPISISPGTINLGAGGWRTRSLFKVLNTANTVYYQVIVKLRISTPVILPKDIDIEWAAPKRELFFEVGGVIACGEMIRIDGVDQAGNNAIFLWLASLDPGEVCTFILTNNSRHEFSKFTQPKVLVSIQSFAPEPAPTRIVQGKKIDIPFKLPEDITLNRVIFLMGRSA